MATRFLTANFASTAAATPGYLLNSLDTVLIAANVLGTATGADADVVSGGALSRVVLAGQLVSTSGAAIGFTGEACSVTISAGGAAIGATGVEFFGGANTLTNDGLIIGDVVGVTRLNVIASGTGDTLINHGTIGGRLYAIAYSNVEARDDTVINTGTIDGVVALGGGDDRFDSSTGTLTAQVRGSAGNDTLIGSAYADSLAGDADDDALHGNAGDDRLTGGDGSDLLNGGAGLDIASYIGSPAVQVSLTDPAQNTGHAAGDRFVGIEGLWGSASDDTLTGNAAGNVLDGRAGADLLVGLAGDDVYFVDDAGDVVRDVIGVGLDGGRDTVYSRVSFNLGSTGAETLVLRGGFLDLNARGSSAANTIRGNAGENVIAGAAGNDLLYGGGGLDAFRFDTALSATANVDRLADFSVDDTIQLDRTVFSALAAPGALPASMFRAGSSALDGSDRIVYNPSTGALLYDSDGNGALAPVLFAMLPPGLALTPGEFTILA